MFSSFPPQIEELLVHFLNDHRSFHIVTLFQELETYGEARTLQGEVQTQGSLSITVLPLGTFLQGVGVILSVYNFHFDPVHFLKIYQPYSSFLRAYGDGWTELGSTRLREVGEKACERSKVTASTVLSPPAQGNGLSYCTEPACTQTFLWDMGLDE